MLVVENSSITEWLCWYWLWGLSDGPMWTVRGQSFILMGIWMSGSNYIAIDLIVLKKIFPKNKNKNKSCSTKSKVRRLKN